jgi:hypothetical protein
VEKSISRRMLSPELFSRIHPGGCINHIEEATPKNGKMLPTRGGGVVTQHTTAYCNIQVVDITLVKYQFTNITSLRVVQQKHNGLYSSTEYYKP